MKLRLEGLCVSGMGMTRAKVAGGARVGQRTRSLAERRWGHGEAGGGRRSIYLDVRIVLGVSGEPGGKCKRP